MPPDGRHFGRLHPLLIHFPIALAHRRGRRPKSVASSRATRRWRSVAVGECAARRRRSRSLRPLPAGGSHRRRASTLRPLLDWHRWLGTIGAVVTVAALATFGADATRHTCGAGSTAWRCSRAASLIAVDRTSRGTAGVGCRLPAPVKEVNRAYTDDDESDLDRRHFLQVHGLGRHRGRLDACRAAY